jgi:hypothetical protein
MRENKKTILKRADSKIKFFFFLEVIIVIIYLISALYDSGLLNNFIKKSLPVLTGFNWGRVYIFNRILWYVLFGLCLRFILNFDISKINFLYNIKLPLFLPKLAAGVLVCLQLKYILLSPVYYNDQAKTWLNETIRKNNFISYKEYFAKEFFDKIKEDISYSGEKVVAFGYHPSVLMYNGFNCIDGYNNAYPLSYMRKFRTLIAPELEINQWAREYYDKWGGRMYLYNSKFDYEPTRNKNFDPVKLNIDMEVFRNTFNGKYILSRAEISNSDALGLRLVKRYYDEESIYTIYLYTVR